MNLQSRPGVNGPAKKVSGRNFERRVTAVLGPTNTGKTYLAIERMLGHSSGIIGLPLRLLAREVYNRVVEKAGADKVALITGEEKIKPPNPSYWIATVEAMPRDLDVAFVAVDEIQLAGDLDRGHTFTDRLLNRRGREETMMIGADTMAPVVEMLLPNPTIVRRPRLSTLVFAGERKLSRLPRRSAIVAFSAEEVYAIAELIRRQSGGAAVVLGALSPRTRNAQVDMFQAGEVDYIVATDAIGMGLNLEVDHIAFAGDRKFDGWQYRRLNPAEFAQIAGRAGRHVRDGTFGTTGRCAPLDPELVEALENHRFDAMKMLQWRNSDLDFSSIRSLQSSLEQLPGRQGLTRAPLAEDVIVLDILARDAFVQRNCKTTADIMRLWDVCQVPDYRKVSPSAHSELVSTLFGFVVRGGLVPDDWFSMQLSKLDRIDGDIDTLSARIAQVRTFNYIANRPDWLNDPIHWQSVTRQVEDNLSDALHERLAHRFVDRRTSMLMRRLRENTMLEAEITAGGDVLVEGEHIGVLQGFRFTGDPQAEGEAKRALNAAAQKALAAEIDGRAKRVGDAVNEAFVLAHDGTIRWLGEPIAKLTAGEQLLKPRVRLLADEQLTGAALEGVTRRLDLWVENHIKTLLGPLLELESGEGLEGLARGIAFEIAEALGVLERSRVANRLRELDQEARGSLRKRGVRFGAFTVYLPQLLKPAPRTMAAQLWALKHNTEEDSGALDDVAKLAASGRTSFAADEKISRELYQAAGFRLCGKRAVRVDILERLADLIRPAVSYKPGQSVGEPPPGTADRDGFVVTVAMTSLAGCAGEDFASILTALGYAVDRREGPAITVPLLEKAPTSPIGAQSKESKSGSSSGDANQTVIDESLDAVAMAVEAFAAPVQAPKAEVPPVEDVSKTSDKTSEKPDEGEGAVVQRAATDAASSMAADTASSGAANEVQAGGATAAAPSANEQVDSGEAKSEEIAATGVSDAAVTEDAGAQGTEQDQGATKSEGGAEIQAPEVTGSATGATDVQASPSEKADVPAGVDGAEKAEASDEGPQLIEVWRPRRSQGRQHQRNRQGQNRGNQNRADRQNQPRGARSHQRPARGNAEGQNVAGDGAPGSQQDRKQANSSQARHGRDDGTGGRPSRNRRGKPAGRSDNHKSNRSFSSANPSRGRNKEPDPNSPFAKLAALKAEMEKKDDKD